jgi:starch synthase (maltosyl-transferring)
MAKPSQNVPSKAPLPSDILGPVGRFPILDVWPTVTNGRSAKATVGEPITIRATATREGHDSLGVSVVLTSPKGASQTFRAQSGFNDVFSAEIVPDEMGMWSFRIESWDDVWGTWHHAAGLKVPADVDVEVELEEGARIFERALIETLSTAKSDLQKAISDAVKVLRDKKVDPKVRLAAAFNPIIDQAMHDFPIRDLISSSDDFPILVESKRALYGAWYEFFPRSEGATLKPYKTGTFKTAMKRLPAIADMGFQVVYVPPIHPIGKTNRKGRNNTLTPKPEDVGSPWAIGSADGGHDAVNPELGTLADFDAFVAEIKRLNMEIALDLALQASPDHPWVKSHPEWFKQRNDGSIAFAENPPKKYQDIYPMYFDTDPEGLYNEIERIVRFWMNRGVRIFRVDNPHTKPVWMWQRLIAAINANDPDVIFLAEAFTTPAMMRVLAEVGFQQSYTYFTWRNDKHGLTQYINELAHDSSAYMRPNFFANTPDILPTYLQTSGPAGFAIRATLAATLSPTWGIYSGFEIYESAVLKEGGEEYLNSEKFELRPRDWQAAEDEGRTLAPYITRLNELRRDHKALQQLRNVVFHNVDDNEVIAFSKTSGDDTVLVICTLDPKGTRDTWVHLDMPALGFNWDDRVYGHDLVTDTTWTWSKDVKVHIDPYRSVAHVVTLRRMS